MIKNLMTGAAGRWRQGVRAIVQWAWAGAGCLMAATQAAAACEPPLARMASVQGLVEVRRGAEAPWQRAEMDQPLCAGDLVRVGERSRAALLMSNETTLRLDQQTSVTLLAPEAPRGTLVEQLRGIVNVITRTPRPFRLTTPFVNANVEGTEFLVRVDEAQASVLVYEGHVVASNAAGRVDLAAGEQAVGPAGAAPRKSLVLRPRDAVQWAVHYPTVQPRVGADLPAVRQAAALAAEGRVAEAVASLDARPAQERTGAFRLQRAALLLQVGRADQALPELTSIAAGDPAHAEALALQAIVALVRNDTAGALALAEAAVAADPRATAALLALSYVQQSRFDLDAATVHARAAVAQEPGHALAWARVAELALQAGDQASAREAAERAVQHDPALARAHSVLGFSLLAAFDTAAARQSFQRAIRLDQGDPLPRMGQGLALIREGQLEAGRQSLELAVALDPESAQLRSTLGKAYAQERRAGAAQTQWSLARERDPLDPTPWFYGAMQQLLDNRPVQALDEVMRSIALNDNRAVLRPRLLLNDDRAVRGTTLARIYDELGFGPLAVTEATRALALEPASAAAHRFLADAYSGRDRHEAAVASQTLQALLLQPVQPAYLLPRRSSSALMGSVDESVLGTPNDDSRYFDERGVSGRAGLAGGTRGLWSAELSAAYAGESLALDAGAFRYHSGGFRPNSELNHQVDEVLLQGRVLPTLNLQGHWRDRHSTYGQLRSNFDAPGAWQRGSNDVHQRDARLGLAWRPRAGEVITLSYGTLQRDGNTQFGFVPRQQRLLSDLSTRTLEGQYQLDTRHGHLLLGAAWPRYEAETIISTVDPNVGPAGPCSVQAPCSTLVGDVAYKQDHVYAYWQQPVTPTLHATLGLAHVRTKLVGPATDVWLPKLGLLWQPAVGTTLRAAAFRTVKRLASLEQALEPTHVAGFTQLFDDSAGVVSRVAGLGADVLLSPQLRLSAEAVERSEEFPGALRADGSGRFPSETWIEQQGRLSVLWTPTTRLAVRGTVQHDGYRRHPHSSAGFPVRVRTDELPVAVRYFLDDGWFGELAMTHVRQQVRRVSRSSEPAGSERFNVFDFTLGHRVRSAPVTVTLTAKNLFGQTFRYMDDSLRTGEIKLAKYQPVRSVVLAVQTAF
ncbi:TonB-dependent receptor domain-containing protein [Aquincola tertiaricarbonis]|uniref:TonB-dependent receptor domain-containing protein n=1 Tax=Aquincola tertiaricarbonis TaxID=391953 RepID=UPI000614F57A|nr:TonB-dependent receptor [Aquincola tertiaricarbonis]